MVCFVMGSLQYAPPSERLHSKEQVIMGPDTRLHNGMRNTPKCSSSNPGRHLARNLEHAEVQVFAYPEAPSLGRNWGHERMQDPSEVL